MVFRAPDADLEFSTYLPRTPHSATLYAATAAVGRAEVDEDVHRWLNPGNFGFVITSMTFVAT